MHSEVISIFVDTFVKNPWIPILLFVMVMDKLNRLQKKS